MKVFHFTNQKKSGELETQIENENISKIVDNQLCNGCGTCFSICPSDCISIILDSKNGILKANVDSSQCLNCGVCLDVCPSNVIDFTLESREKISKYNDFFGYYLNIYTGYSNDETIRYNSSSGGLITTILLYLLDKKKIDGAILARPNCEKPYLFEAYLAKTKEDVINSMGSKYCPISLNSIFKSLNVSNGKYAVVALPCQLYGIKMLENKNLKLKNMIKYHFGLLCGGTPNYLATEYFLKQHKINLDDLSKLNYRGHGWPGNIFVKYKNGKETLITRRPKKIKEKLIYQMAFTPFFNQYRCLACYDRFARFSDVSFGDAWMDKYKNDTNGTSIVLTRTKEGDELMEKLIDENIINLEICKEFDIIDSQGGLISFIKNYNITRKYFNNKKIKNPKITQNNVFVNDLLWKKKLNFLFVGTNISKNKKLWRFLWIYIFMVNYYLFYIQKIYRLVRWK